jgi:hypothetical protein
MSILKLTKFTTIEGFDQLCAFGVSMAYGTIGALMVLVCSRLLLFAAELSQLQKSLWMEIITGISGLASCLLFIFFCAAGILSLVMKTYAHAKQQLKEAAAEDRNSQDFK